jgi:hypothetical protein
VFDGEIRATQGQSLHGAAVNYTGRRQKAGPDPSYSLPYGKWRDFDPEDTVRFYPLRLREAGMIKSTPQKIIARGTDWRFLSDLKKELKG